MIEKVFKDGFKVTYNPITFEFKSERNCTHNFILVDFKIANGSFQLRKYCTRCLTTIGRAEKRSEYEGMIFLKKDFSKYKAFRESLDNEIRAFIKDLVNKRNDLIMNYLKKYE